MENAMKYIISLTFEEIKLPPFQDILVIGKNSPHGKHGISKSVEPLNPNGFEIIDINDDKVDSVFVNKRILVKISKEKLIDLLRVKVFPFISEGELLRVDLKIVISYTSEEEM
jgi:hypothetical protein